MAMYVIYRGQFGSRDNNLWEVTISCERDSEPDNVGVLSFSGDEPLLIEWLEKEKDEPICSSTATVNLLSPGDRTYIDLYSIEVGQIRLDVYKNDDLYWSGMLDPEFYEEPYSTMKDYEVSLTFSDFGILERLKYNLAGFKTLEELVEYAIGRAGIQYSDIDEGYISTRLTDGTSHLQLSELSVRSENFYDEDGEASSLWDMLDGIMRPLGLKMIQRGGVIWIFDLNGLRTGATSKNLTWMGTDQMLGVDKVYNNVKITWSPYADCDKLLPEECWTEPVDANETRINNVDPKSVNGGRCQILSYHYTADLDRWLDGTDVGFTLWLSQYGREDNVTIDDTDARYFKIVPQNDGTEKEGVAVRWTSWRGSHQRVETGHFLWWTSYEEGWGMEAKEYGITLDDLKNTQLGRFFGDSIFTSRQEWLPPVEESDNLLLRITLPMLLDCRFNPFEGAVNLMDSVRGKQNDHYGTWQERGNFVYVPVCIYYQPDGSNQVYVWSNTSLLRDTKKYGSLNETVGQWVRVSGQMTQTVAYLCYCDSARDGDKCGVMGWQTNRQASGNRTVDVCGWLKNLDEGQYIPYPIIDGFDGGGKIWIEVHKGWIISDGSDSLTGTVSDHDLWSKISFILFQLPQIEAVNNKPYDMEIDNSDVEYAAQLNDAAKEDLEIETVCGSRENGFPMARGAYFRSDDYSQIRQLKRAGRTAAIEELLIGTLFSQYAKRHTKLTGTTELPDETLLIYREAMQPQDTRFLLTAAVEDCGQDLCETTVVELSPDEYDKAD